ncbi:TlpA family protein disulfide reductase [Nonomuraea typhae]|uniref:TlpA family protein disulfide reductase n=1 Tax=Nonomuraea typhae TaxID=2603600 RepID=A0ABW7YLB1_9ACTN
MLVVVLVGSLVVINLIFTLGVIKRLREHTELLRGSFDPVAIEAGTEIGEFVSVTVDGERIAHESFTEETTVAFFAPDCRPCQEKLPKLAAYGKSIPGGRDRVLAVVVASADLAADFVALLRPVAHVVVEEPAGPMAAAFGIRAFPALLSVAPNHSGRLVVKAGTVDMDRPATVSA